MERRTFLASLAAASAAGSLAQARPAAASGRVTLLHTNDTHSRVEPFGPGNGTLSGRGGMARRASLVKRLRAELGAVLLLDAGDTFQGTPYFNLWKGRLDYQLMRMVGYDAGTLGNHDFDNGVAPLVEAIEGMKGMDHRHAPFEFVNCNFDCTGAPSLARHLRPWIVRDFPGIRVGITGVGVAFQGLVAPANCKGITWIEPDQALKPVVERLRTTERCDVVVLLSHLGYDNHGQAWDDPSLAKAVPGLDVIIGGHSHTFLEAPVKVPGAWGDTYINQVGFAGVNLGRMDLTASGGQLRAASGGSLPVRA